MLTLALLRKTIFLCKAEVVMLVRDFIDMVAEMIDDQDEDDQDDEDDDTMMMMITVLSCYVSVAWHVVIGVDLTNIVLRNRSWKTLQQNLRFLNMVSRAKGSCNRTIHDSTIIQESNLRFLKKTRTWMPIEEDVELKEKSDHHRHLSRRRKPPDETKKIRTPQGEELTESPHK
ncbi:hypothetical protein Tco_0608495 [Tanacetum coccineum]